MAVRLRSATLDQHSFFGDGEFTRSVDTARTSASVQYQSIRLDRLCSSANSEMRGYATVANRPGERCSVCQHAVAIEAVFVDSSSSVSTVQRCLAVK